MYIHNKCILFVKRKLVLGSTVIIFIIYYYVDRPTEYQLSNVPTWQMNPLNIELPLSINPLRHLLSIQQKLMRQNFIPSFVVLAGSVIMYHFETINMLQGECPLILLYSKKSGTGTPVIK